MKRRLSAAIRFIRDTSPEFTPTNQSAAEEIQSDTLQMNRRASASLFRHPHHFFNHCNASWASITEQMLARDSFERSLTQGPDDTF